MHGLRHFVRWRHPRLLLTELGPGSAPVFYEVCRRVLQQRTHATQQKSLSQVLGLWQDAHVAIAALHTQEGEWQAPAWMLRPAAAEHLAAGSLAAATLPTQANTSSSSSSSSSSGSSDGNGDSKPSPADAYSEPSISSAEEDTRHAAVAAACQGQPPAVPGPLPAEKEEEPDEAVPTVQGSAACAHKAKQQLEREAFRQPAMMRLDAILGGRSQMSTARQMLLQVILHRTWVNKACLACAPTVDKRVMPCAFYMNRALCLQWHTCPIAHCLEVALHCSVQELAVHRTGRGTAAQAIAARAAAAESISDIADKNKPSKCNGKGYRMRSSAAYNSCERSRATAQPAPNSDQPEFVPLEDRSNPVFVQRTGHASQQTGTSAQSKCTCILEACSCCG